MQKSERRREGGNTSEDVALLMKKKFRVMCRNRSEFGYNKEKGGNSPNET